jgi:hypothetical protein
MDAREARELTNDSVSAILPEEVKKVLHDIHHKIREAAHNGRDYIRYKIDVIVIGSVREELAREGYICSDLLISESFLRVIEIMW